MTDARTITQSLGGKWYGRYGAAPCPICQPERRKGQNGLTLADGAKGLLLHCKKGGCTYRDILAAAGIAPGARGEARAGAAFARLADAHGHSAQSARNT